MRKSLPDVLAVRPVGRAAKVATRSLAWGTAEHLQRLRAEGRLESVKAQRDELCAVLDVLLDREANPEDAMRARNEGARLVNRIHVAQACEQGPDHE